MKLITLAICLLAFVSCKKETVTPIETPNYFTSYFGVWVSQDGNTQYTIKNYPVDSKIYFKSYVAGNFKYLEVGLPGSVNTYKVEFLSKSDMVLTDKYNTETKFRKTKSL